ncbi:hypothetical protein BKA65DRAFT_551286 [Rhexocercosporidium sp. MPI-PUGE-AT-0058]|nr:hypothetical protein BKA65DRAFT_551286 [Rhexocercosporidium sp. MPI-PUGE-AT-0058]
MAPTMVPSAAAKPRTPLPNSPIRTAASTSRVQKMVAAKSSSKVVNSSKVSSKADTVLSEGDTDDSGYTESDSDGDVEMTDSDTETEVVAPLRETVTNLAKPATAKALKVRKSPKSRKSVASTNTVDATMVNPDAAASKPVTTLKVKAEKSKKHKDEMEAEKVILEGYESSDDDESRELKEGETMGFTLPPLRSSADPSPLEIGFLETDPEVRRAIQAECEANPPKRDIKEYREEFKAKNKKYVTSDKMKKRNLKRLRMMGKFAMLSKGRFLSSTKGVNDYIALADAFNRYMKPKHEAKYGVGTYVYKGWNDVNSALVKSDKWHEYMASTLGVKLKPPGTHLAKTRPAKKKVVSEEIEE